MATKTERNVIDVAGLVQGIVLVTFPAASTVFTKPSEYALSNTQYGALFLPQVVLAITASLTGAKLARRISMKRVYLLGLACSMVSMALLLVSATVKTNQSVAYPLLLIATAFLGTGFGLTVPALNTYASLFNPERVDRAVLTLNALLGLGTALAPVLVAIFVGLGFWWGLPIVSTVLLVALLIVSAPLALQAQTPARATEGKARSRLPSRFWLYASFAVAYGICETMNGNWSQLEMTGHLGASATQASIALAAFWAMVTVGRVLFSAIGSRLPESTSYRMLPVVLIGTFILTGALSGQYAILGILLFALAGLGCSALLPLTISFGEEDLTAIATVMAGSVIAFYQFGYGIAAFGVGPLQDAGVSLSSIFGFTSIVAAVMAVLSRFVVHRAGEPAPVQVGKSAGPFARGKPQPG